MGELLVWTPNWTSDVLPKTACNEIVDGPSAQSREVTLTEFPQDHVQQFFRREIPLLLFRPMPVLQVVVTSGEPFPHRSGIDLLLKAIRQLARAGASGFRKYSDLRRDILPIKNLIKRHLHLSGNRSSLQFSFAVGSQIILAAA